MSQIIPLNTNEASSSIFFQIAQKSRELCGRAVVLLNTVIKSLEDPRFASAGLFFVNFAIIEIATRTSDLIGSFFSKDTTCQRNLRLAIVTPIKLGIIGAINYGIVKATDIKLHPLVITAVVAVSFVVRYQMSSCSE